MTIVIGPFDREEWNTMLFLKHDLAFLRSKNAEGKYDTMIKKEQHLFSDFCNRVAA